MNRGIYKKNLNAMKKWYSDFADELEKGQYELDDINIQVQKSWDSETIYRIQKDGRNLYLNGKRNVQDALDTWENRIGEVHKHAPVFLLGLGSGIYLKRVIACTDETVTVVVYEPSLSLFLKTLNEIDLSEEIENRPIAFMVKGISDKGMEQIIKQLVSEETVEFLKCEIHPNYRELFPEEILDAMKQIRKRTSFVLINNRAGVYFSTHLAKNQMQNMRFVCDGYNTRKLSEVIPYDGAAILVSAGPSLDKNVQELKKAKNKAFILAVDTAMKPLIRAGIVPDAFITIDAKKPLDLVEMDEIRDVPIIAPPTANYDIIKKQRGKKIFYYDGYVLAMSSYLAVGKFLPDVSRGGSVACSGLSLLYKMGFDTIILVGQDLAYLNDKTHAAGTIEDDLSVECQISVKGNYEENVTTTATLKLYVEWFENYIAGMKKRRNVRIINATEGGAFIKGTELMKLSDAIKENCTKETDFDACIQKMESEFSEEERKVIIKYLHSVPDEFDEIRNYAKSLYSSYQKVLQMSKSGKMDKNAYLKQLKKIKKLTKKSESKSVYQMISASMAVAEYIVRSESLYEKDTIEEEGKAIATQGMKYAKLLEKCALVLKDFSKETLLKIE